MAPCCFTEWNVIVPTEFKMFLPLWNVCLGLSALKNLIVINIKHQTILHVVILIALPTAWCGFQLHFPLSFTFQAIYSDRLEVILIEVLMRLCNHITVPFCAVISLMHAHTSMHISKL